MKTTEPKTSRSMADWLLPAFCVFCATGAAITGTMLWMQNRESQNVPASSQTATSSPAKNPLLNPMLEAPNASTQNMPNSNAPFSNAPFANAPQENAPNTDALDGNAQPHGAPPSTAGMPHAQAALLLANWHYDVKHWNEAIKKYHEAIELGLDNADVRTDLGNCYRFSNQPQKALEQYRVAQKSNPNHENSLFNQAGLFASELKQPARGVAIWNEYLKRFPQGQNASRAKQLLARYNGPAGGSPSGGNSSDESSPTGGAFADTADRAAMADLKTNAWVKDLYVSPGHMNIGVVRGEKDWTAPRIISYACGVLRKHGSKLNWIRFVDIEAVARQGQSPNQAEIYKSSCP